MHRHPVHFGVSLCVAVLMVSAGRSAPIMMSGPDGGCDYASVDPVHDMLYVARTDSVAVYDLSGHKPPVSPGSIRHGHAAPPISGGTALLVTSGADGSSGRVKVRTLSKSRDGRFAVATA